MKVKWIATTIAIGSIVFLMWPYVVDKYNYTSYSEELDFETVSIGITGKYSIHPGFIEVQSYGAPYSTNFSVETDDTALTHVVVSKISLSNRDGKNIWLLDSEERIEFNRAGFRKATSAGREFEIGHIEPSDLDFEVVFSLCSATVCTEKQVRGTFISSYEKSIRIAIWDRIMSV